MKEMCIVCDGTGKIDPVSECCGATPQSIGDYDCDTQEFGICSSCHDHCEYITECEECGGTGFVKVIEEEGKDEHQGAANH